MEFLKNPNLPDRPVKGVIIDCRADAETTEGLKKLGIEPILSYKSNRLRPAVCAHPDMTILHLGGNRFICAPDAYEYYKSALPEAEIIRSGTEIASEYPRDVTYNITLLGGFVFMNTRTEQRRIVTGKKIIDVRQGYTKCGICVAGENAVITSDGGIYAAARENGIDALLIAPGNIELPGMSCGFIGGASGLIAPDTLAVNGDITTHPDGGKIIGFCKKHGVAIVPLRSGALLDIGSILPVF